ncbi:hypothetical protein ROT00_15860 [Agromyces mediolanus]|uniref:hypothetical protein n=1 Tax=Agromyces mediolanus TaxID=41986 RepID=UPI0038397C7F
MSTGAAGDAAGTPTGRPARLRLPGGAAGPEGVAFPPFIDHHVHLQMVDPDAAPQAGIAGVVDLGAELTAIAALAAREPLPRVVFAGQFLTAPGGYPSDRWWLRPGSLRELPAATRADDRRALPDPIETAVAEQAAFGARLVKIMLNADAGPVFDRATVDAIVVAARARGLLVATHAEGEGTARLAIEAGADVLVHAPFTERLDDELVALAAASGQCWITTFDIHARAGEASALGTAIDNTARFLAAGGRVLYGTDLGNGELPDGVNPGELAAMLAAGLAPGELIGALSDPWPLGDPVEWGGDALATFVPGPQPQDAEELPAWLAGARVVPIENLEFG